MLTSLKIENFKNFQEEQQLIFSDEDSYNFSILVGKNGAGLTFTVITCKKRLDFTYSLYFLSLLLFLATCMFFLYVSPI